MGKVSVSINDLITVGERTLSIREWAKENSDLGLTPEAISLRIRKGWDPKKAVTVASQSLDPEREAKFLEKYGIHYEWVFQHVTAYSGEYKLVPVRGIR